MSLDVTLIRKRWISYDNGVSHQEEEEECYSANITHNLNSMAMQCGLYEALWRPYRLVDSFDIPDGEYDQEMDYESNVVIRAGELIELLEMGLERLKSNPQLYQKYNSPNGWGKYENFVPFVEKYLEACKEFPDSIVIVSR